MNRKIKYCFLMMLLLASCHQSSHPQIKPKIKNKPIPKNCFFHRNKIQDLELLGILRDRQRAWALVTNPDGMIAKIESNDLLGKSCKKVNSIGDQAIFIDHQFSMPEYARIVPTPKTLSKNRLSIYFNQLDIKTALKWLALFTQTNIVVGNKVQAVINLRLNNLSGKTILETLLRTYHLQKEKIHDVTFINTIPKPSKTDLSRFYFAITLKYAQADHLEKLIKNFSKKITVLADKRTNHLLIYGPKKNVDIIKNFIKKIDIPSKQVMITAHLVSIDRNCEKNLGIQFGNSENNVSGNLGIALLKLAKHIKLNMALSALEKEGKANILSNPKLMTANRQPANIESGEEIPYQESVSQGVTSTVFKKAVLKLEITPNITPNKKILLKIKVNQDKRGSVEVKGVPTIDTHKITTEILANDQETVVLGGVYEQTNTNHEEKIPLLGDLPILGHLFQYQTEAKNQRELLIFITPKLISTR